MGADGQNPRRKATAVKLGFDINVNITEDTMSSSPTETLKLPDYAPIPKASLGPALNSQGYYVGRVERNLYWITDGVYQSAFLTTREASCCSMRRPPSVTTCSGP